MAENDDDYTDEVARIYEDVLDTLSKSSDLSDFDTDTLLDVYDYACDISDEYVQSEVMTYILSRNPRCLQMLERKAVRYMQLSELQGAKMEAAKLPPSSFVRRLITTRINWSENNWRSLYDKLLSGIKRGSINDFGAFSLVDMAISADDLPHLVTVLPEVLPLLQYPEDFLVDLSDALYDSELYDDAVRVIQELSTLEPFNVEHWLRLADLYVSKLNNLAEAYNALEYALALDPNSPKALMMMGDVLVKTQADMTRADEIAEKLMSMSAYRPEGLYLKAGILIHDERNAEALDCLFEYLDDCNTPLDVLLLMFSFSDEELSEERKARMKRVIEEAEMVDLSNWIDDCKRLLDVTGFDNILELLSTTNVSVTDSMFDQLVCLDYRKGRFEKVITAYEARYGHRIELKSGFLYLMSLLRLGRTKGVGALAGEMAYLAANEMADADSDAYILQTSYVRLAMSIAKCADEASDGKADQKRIDSIDVYFRNTD